MKIPISILKLLVAGDLQEFSRMLDYIGWSNKIELAVNEKYYEILYSSAHKYHAQFNNIIVGAHNEIIIELYGRTWRIIRYKKLAPYLSRTHLKNKYK